MTWQPNLDMGNTPQGSKLLNLALNKLGVRPFEPISDDLGVFAFDIGDFILVAKDYIFGNIVSCHARACVAAMNRAKPLLMFINKADAFYKFNPSDIWQHSQPNIRLGQTMLNFNIHLGVRYYTYGAF